MHKHDWQLKWEGTVRKCRICKVTHYWHHCENRWETIPNPSYGETGLNFYQGTFWHYEKYENHGGMTRAIVAQE